MAHTARKGDEKKEYFDPPDVLNKKVDQLVGMIRGSKHMIAFTVSSLLHCFIVVTSYCVLILFGLL